MADKKAMTNSEKRDTVLWVWLVLCIAAPMASLAIFWKDEVYETLGINDDDKD